MVDIDLKTKEGLEYIIEQKRKGKQLNEVAEELGYSGRESLSYYLKVYHNTTWNKLGSGGKNFKGKSIIKKNGGLSRVIKLKNKGYTKAEVAEEFGLGSVGALDYYLSQLGMVWGDIGKFATSQKRNYEYDELDDIMSTVNRLIDEGYTLKEISEETGLNSNTIYAIFRSKDTPLHIKQKREEQRLKESNKNKSINVSKRVNKTGFYKVRKQRGGFVYSKGDKKTYSKNLGMLKDRVLARGWEWFVLDEDKARATCKEEGIDYDKFTRTG